MQKSKIKPIPKYIIERIRKRDRAACPEQKGAARFYAYLTKNDGELVKITVAVKNHKKHWYCKQCAVHGVHSDKCFLKDMCFTYVVGYRVGWYDEGLQTYRKWYEYGQWDTSDDKYFDPYAPIVNKEYLASLSEYRYSGVELFEGVNILQYLRLYERFPQLEYVMKTGLHRFWDCVTILRKIGKDKNFGKWLIAHKDELMREYHYIIVILRSYRTGRPLAELQAYESAKLRLQHDDKLRPIKELFKGRDLERFFSYIGKQNANPHSYRDYLNACNTLGLDMSADKNRFPHDFKRWHDMRIDQYATAKALSDEKERPELYRQFAAIAQKYLALQNRKNENYAIFIAKSPADLIREGEILSHCVGRMNYDRKMLREESLIFFVRDASKPDAPFVTVEYSLQSKKILQCYGAGGAKPDNSVLTFVNQVWLPYANRKLKKLQTTAA